MVSNEDIITAYRNTGSVWKAAKRLGLCGQSVWERLKAIGYKLPARNWSHEEDAELDTLAGNMPLAEIARRLGRPYAAIASRISKKGLQGRYSQHPRKRVSLRGTGLTKSHVSQLKDELHVFCGTLTQFCRQRGLAPDPVVTAFQKYEPGFWQEYSRNASKLSAKSCPNCGRLFYPLNMKQQTCSRKCQAHARADRQYFNGNRRNTIGLSEGICQLCLRDGKTLSAHHVWGKDNDQDADFLIALCNGCHELVSRLASVKLCADRDFIERLVIWASMRRFGDRKPLGFHCCVDVEELSEEELLDEAW